MTQPTIAQLYNLTDRAATGLSNDEQQRLRDGLARLAEYENTINWMTTCTGCARVLDSCIRETERAEKAEAALTEARRIHRETCPLAQGKVGPGFTCGMCDTLDGERPAAPDGAFAIGAPPGIGVDEARQMRDELLAATRPAEPGGLRARLVDLHARWIAAGPPPLGTLINRWWDIRLAELGAALQPTAHNDGPSTAECADADRAWPLQKAGE